MVSTQEEYWSLLSPKYDALADALLGKYTRSLIREHLSRESRLGRTVEFGCGTGFMTKVLAEKADSLVATDLTDDMAKLAKENLKGFDHIRFEAADCQKTAFPDKAFDTVFMSLVLHYVDSDRTLAEMNRILRPGGMLIIANLTRGLKSRYKPFYLARYFYCELTISHMLMPSLPVPISRPQLLEKLEKAGFKVALVEQVQDTSSVLNAPVDYIKAIKT